MKALNVYQQLQIGLVLLAVGMFVALFVLDLAGYALSDFARGTLQAVWSIMLLLINPEKLSELIQKSSEVNNEKTASAGTAAEL